MDLGTPNETKAEALSSDRNKLFDMLREHQRLLDTPYNRMFQGCVFEFENKRLCGQHGFTLQWQLRRLPDQPVGYDNQQTSVGITRLSKKEGYSRVYRRIWGPRLPDGCLGPVVVHPVRFIGRVRGGGDLCLVRAHTIHDPLGEQQAAQEELADRWEIHRDFEVDVDTQLKHQHGAYFRFPSK